jgi:hypothetical protein
MNIFWRMTLMSLLLFGLLACNNEADQASDSSDDFDRGAMLEYWADDLIIPAFEDYQLKLETLVRDIEAFVAAPNPINLANVYSSFESGYKAWQWVSLYDIGPAETASLRNYSNVFPTDTAQLNASINAANVNLTLPSTFDIQGWPAIDYMIYGIETNEDERISVYANSDAHRAFLVNIASRLKQLNEQVLSTWKMSYRSTFFQNTGSGADASVNKLVNDFVFHYEKEFRAGKIGIPAGVFSNNPLPSRAEALYHNGLAKELALISLAAHSGFFNGSSFSGDATGPSLKAYLDYLEISNGDLSLSERIMQQFEASRLKIEALPNSFSEAATNATTTMLETFDVLQSNVIWLKVDMLQALNIRVDYVDADGD